MSYDEYAYRYENVRYHIAIGMVKVSQYWKPALIGLAILAAFIYGRCGGEPPAVTPGVTDTVMVRQPTAAPTIKERIVYRPVEVERRVVEERVDTLVVREFVAAATDTLLEPIHLPYSLEYNGDRLRLWGTMSNGDLTLHEFNVKPTFRAGWAADSAWAREERLSRFPTMKVAAGTAIVAGVVVCLLVCR